MRLVPIRESGFRALASGDLDAARLVTGAPLGEYFVSDEISWLWAFRLEQIGRDPESEPWLAKVAIADEADGAETEIAVGHAGFHGPPDENGMVEIGYSVDPLHRRRGYATAIVAALLEFAAGEESIVTVRASIRPDNAASLATIAPYGFAAVGEQWDEQDGLETIFERAARPPGS